MQERKPSPSLISSTSLGQLLLELDGCEDELLPPEGDEEDEEPPPAGTGCYAGVGFISFSLLPSSWAISFISLSASITCSI